MALKKKKFVANKIKSQSGGSPQTPSTESCFFESRAVIDVTKVVFRDVFSAPGTGPAERGSTCELGMPEANPYVCIENGEVVVTGPVTIAFQFPEAHGDYFPSGIAFLLQSGGPRRPKVADKIGHSNFPQEDIRLSDHAVVIHDAYSEPKRKTIYKFSIIIQNRAGQMGIIDPIIVHDPTRSHA